MYSQELVAKVLDKVFNKDSGKPVGNVLRCDHVIEDQGTGNDKANRSRGPGGINKNLVE